MFYIFSRYFHGMCGFLGRSRKHGSDDPQQPHNFSTTYGLPMFVCLKSNNGWVFSSYIHVNMQSRK